MIAKIRDYIPLLKEAIADARAAGLGAAANELESAAFAAYTTSSEMLCEHGLAIERFLKATRKSLPGPIEEKLKACLTETELVHSGWRGLMALLHRGRYARLLKD